MRRKQTQEINDRRRSLLLLFGVIILVFPASMPVAQAQIAPFSDQYLINPFHANPAIAGTERYMPLRLSTRQQWIGINNGPSTQSISLHKRFRANGIRFTPRGFINKGKNSFGKVGLGGAVFNYSYGPIKHTGVSLAYAYHAFVGNGRLAFGLSPVFFQYSMNKNGFTLPDGNTTDPLITDPFESVLFLDVSAGMHYYDADQYAGFSTVQLLNSGVKFSELSFDSEDQMSLNPDLARTFYTYYGRFIEFSREMKLEASLWGKYNEQNGFRLDINALMHLREVITAGLTYRFKESAGLLIGVTLDNMHIGYLFEAPFTNEIPSRYTSHQIMINFNLGQPID